MSLPDCFDCKYGGLEHPCRTASGGYDFANAGAAIVAHGRSYRDDDDADEVASPSPVDNPSDWISDCQYELIEDHPALIMPLIVAAIDACETPSDAAFVAAGLIENALVKHGAALIGDLERLAALSPKVPYILSGVWSQSGGVKASVWERLGKAIGAHGRMSDDAREARDGSPVTVLSEVAATALMRDRIGPAAVEAGIIAAA